MLGTPPLEAVLGAGLDNTDHDAVRAFIREATKVGLSLLLVLPGSKLPADMRTVRTRNSEDREAQEAAKIAGARNWEKVKSPSGLALASTDAKVVLKYLDEYVRVFSTWAGPDGQPLSSPPTPKAIKDGAATMLAPVAVNLAAEVGGSRLVVVDCDTAAQLERFLTWTQAPRDLPPTIKSPGQVVDGVAVHSDGGHFYFTLPEGVELPTNLGAITMSGDDGFAVLWNRRYVLIPPSTRPEGAYTLTGRTYDLIPPLHALITDAATQRAERMASAVASRGEGGMADAIDSWAEATPWAALLEPMGWTPTSRPDNCGCEVWTAPGTHASPKSATAHDSGCSLGRYSEVNTPLHVWTDNPGEPLAAWLAEHGTKTVSKLQLAALGGYEGNVGKAMDALGLTPPPPTIDAVAGVDNANVDREAGVSASNLDRPIWGEPTPAAVPAAPQPAVPTPTEVAAAIENGTVDSLQIPNNPGQLTPEQQARVDAALASATARVEGQADLQGRTHLNPCVCTVNTATGDIVDYDCGRELAANDEFGTPPAVLTLRCANCQQVVPKASVLSGGSEFQRDADGAWWHAEFNPEDGTIDGGHLLLTADPGGLEDSAAGGEWISDEAKLAAYNEALAAGAPKPVPPAEPAPFVGVESQQEQHVPVPPPPAPPGGNDTPFADEADDPDPNVLNSQQFGVPVIAPFSHWRDMPPPEYIIDGLIENGGLACVIGAPGVGKSSVALDMACHIATGKSWQGRRTLKTKVLYMPGEGLSGAVQRIAAWEDAHKVEVGTNLLLANSIIKLGASNEAWQEVGNFVIRQGIGFIIFDTFARMALSVEENSATEVGKAVERLDQIRRHANTGVLIVHHTGKHSETARGSSALNGALDSELLVRNGQWDTAQIADASGRLPGKPIELDTTKQKNAEQLDHPIPLLMVNWPANNAPIITGPGGSVDPMQGEIVLARPVPEVVVETAIRIAALVARYPEQGLSRSEVVQYLEMDAYTASRADAAKAWRQKVSEAVDKALRYQLLQTLTGTASGSRYIPDVGTVADARARYAAENITGD